jgi:hypothetical protein
MTTARERKKNCDKKKRRRGRRRSNHTLFADNSIFRPRVKNSEINRLRKQNKIIEEPS